jgi:predicted phage tail protein
MGFGGQKKQSTPTTAPISLVSNNVARITEAICEGKIKGLVNGLNSVYFDETPLQANNGTFNFKGIEVDYRLGTPDQELMQGFQGVETIQEVGVLLNDREPVVRTVTNPEADYLRIKIGLSGLQAQDNNGNVLNNWVRLNIEVNENGTGYKTIAKQWRGLAQSSGGYVTTATSTGFRVILTKKVSNPSDIFMLDNVESATVTYQLLPSGTVTPIVYDVQPTKYSFNNATPQLIPSNLKMENNGVSTQNQYALYYGIDDEIIGLAQGQYKIIPPVGWVVSAVYELVDSSLVIDGRTASSFEREYLVPLPKNNGGSPWDIRVTKLANNDAFNGTKQDETYWTSYVEGIETKINYSNTVVAGLKVDASLFGNNIPKRGYLLDLLEVKIPSNYDPIKRTYDESLGYWDGAFTRAWTNNPAWVLYDLLTNARYGGGQFIDESQVDKFDFYDIAKYCDELVPVAGTKALEPRYTFNYWFANTDSFYSTLGKVANVFHGSVYSSNGIIRLAIDKPKTMTAIFSQANVVGSIFDYSTAGSDEAYSVVSVTYNDPKNLYKQDVVTVEDPYLINIFGYNVSSIDGVGITSEGQARRFGKWLLDSLKNQYTQVEFTVGLDGSDLVIGDVIGIYDPAYAKIRMSGRIKAFVQNFNATGFSAIRLDFPITFLNTETYKISINLPDNTITTYDCTPCDADGVLAYGLQEWVKLPSKITVNQPVVNNVWGIIASNIAPREFYVTSKTELTGDAKFQYKITGIEYDAGKYDRIDKGIVSQKTLTTLQGQDIILHSNITGNGFFTKVNNILIKNLLVSWTPSPDSRVRQYSVYYKTASSIAYTLAGRTSTSSFTIENIPEDVLKIQVDAEQVILGNFVSGGSVFATLDFSANNVAPANVQNFNYILKGTELTFTWDKVEDTDLAGYEIRFSQSKTNTQWALTQLYTTVDPTLNEITIPYLDGTFFIKAIDFYGAYSNIPATRITFEAPDVNINIVEIITESPTFDGVKTGVTATGDILYMSNPLVEDTAFYEFDNAIDLGDIYVSRLTSVLEYIMGDIDSWVAFIPDVSAETTLATAESDIMGNVTSIDTVDSIASVGFIEYTEGMLELQFSTSEDAVSYSPWKTFIVGEYRARAFKFRLVLRSFLQSKIPRVTKLSVTCDMPDRFESKQSVSLTTGWNTITYGTPFKATPAVNVTGSNLQAGEYIKIQNQTSSSFDVQVFDASNVSVARTINWIARGYGKQL